MSTWWILLIDDDEDDYLLTRSMLSQAQGRKIELDWANTYQDGQHLLRAKYYDAVLVDYDLGEKTGIELIRETVSQGYPAPLILYTGRGSYEVDMESMQAGATLYLAKGEANPLLLERSIRYSIERKHNEEALRQAQDSLEQRVKERTVMLMQANTQLAKANELLEKVYNSVHFVLAYMDCDFNFIQVNRNYALADGREPEFYIGKNHFDLFPNAENQAIFRAVVETGEPYFIYAKPFEYAEHPERGVSYWDWSLQPVKEIDGSISGVLLTLVDVTERKKAELALQESQQRLRLIVNTAPIILWAVDREGIFTLAEGNGLLAISSQSEGLVGQSIFERAGSRPEIVECIHRALSGQEVSSIAPAVGNDQEIYQTRYLPQFGDREEVTGVLGVSVAITEKFKESEKKYRDLVYYSQDGIVIVDEQGRVVEWNKGEEQLTGIPKEQVLGKLIWDVHFELVLDQQKTPQAYEKLKALTQQLLSDSPNPQPFQVQEETFKAVDGSICTAQTQVFSIQTDKGRMLCSISHDITKRKQAEQALRQSEERYRSLFHNDHTVMLLVDPQTGKIIDANPAASNFYGYSIQDLKRMSITDFKTLPPDQIQEQMQQASSRKSNHFATCHRLANGDIRDVDIYSGPILVEGQTLLYSIIYDVTERRQQEREIKRISRFPDENPNPVMRISLDGRLLYANKASELILADWKCSVGSFVPENWEEHVFEAAALDSPQEVETECWGRTYSFILQPKSDEGYVNLYGRDVTEHRRAERERERILDELNGVINSMADAVLIFDSSGRLTGVNQSAIRLFGNNPLGQDRLELSGKLSLRHPDGRLLTYEELPSTRALQGQVVTNERLTTNRVDGREITGLNSASPVMVNGTLVGAVLIVRDVTEWEKAQTDLAAYAQRLEQANRELEDFAFIASHDLQEPLRKIEAFGDRLSSIYAASLPVEGLDYLQRMSHAAARMRQMVNDLLALSRVMTKSEPFDKVDLKQVIDQVVSDLIVRIEQTGGQVEIGWLPIITADEGQMYKLFLNLLSNALKFHKTGRSPRVKISGMLISPDNIQDAGRVQIRVEDDGIGFDPQHEEKIFQPFQRLHGRGEYEGTGMGLAICKKIVERHNGRITAESRMGEGAVFTIELPIQQSH